MSFGRAGIKSKEKREKKLIQDTKNNKRTKLNIKQKKKKKSYEEKKELNAKWGLKINEKLKM